MKMKSLYEVSQEFIQALDEAFDPETGEALPTFDELRGQLMHKSTNVAAYILNCEADAAQAKAAIARIKAIQESYERRAEKLREYLAENMKATGIHEIKADDRSFVVKLFVDRDESVEIDEGATFPESLCTDPKPPAPSKQKIKAAILAGEPVAGARIVRKDRLTIK
jgi:Siphovirus Gp157